MIYAKERTMFIIIVMVLIMVEGCSTHGKIAEKLPQRQIDRPYTLPKGIKSWTTSVFNQQTIYADSADANSGAEDDNVSYVNPLNWQFPITDNLSFISSPLPLGLKHQVYRNETSTFGWFAAFYFIYGIAQVDYQYKLSRNIAIKPYLHYEKVDFFFIDYEQKGYGLDLLYQATDRLALTLGMGRARIEAGSDFFEDVFGLSNGSLTNSDRISQSKMGVSYAISTQWNVSASVQQTTFSDVTDDKLRLITLDFVHYWD